MAEFCNECATKLGLPSSEKPLFCEGCGETYTKSLFENAIDIIRKAIAVITLLVAIAFISVIIYFFLKEI